MTKKMTAKSETTGGLNLDDFITGADPITSGLEVENIRSEVHSGKKGGRGPDITAKPVGRPPAAADQLKTKNLQIKLTEAEFDTLKSEAGRIPLAVFVRDRMKDWF